MKAILVSGASTSGKSTFAQKLATLTGFRIYHEDIGDYVIGLIKCHRSGKSNIIFEHNRIFEKVENFVEQYSKVYSIFLNVDSHILKTNFQKKLDRFAYGDFLKYDPLEEQKEIFRRYNFFSRNLPLGSVKWLTLKIRKYEDYDKYIVNLKEELMND